MSAAASGVPADVSEPPDLRDARNILPVRGRNADCYPYRVVRGVRRDRIFDRVLGRLGFGLPCFHAPGWAVRDERPRVSDPRCRWGSLSGVHGDSVVPADDLGRRPLRLFLQASGDRADFLGRWAECLGEKGPEVHVWPVVHGVGCFPGSPRACALEPWDWS